METVKKMLLEIDKDIICHTLQGKADQTQNPWAEKICRCNPQNR